MEEKIINIGKKENGYSADDSIVAAIGLYTGAKIMASVTAIVMPSYIKTGSLARLGMLALSTFATIDISAYLLERYRNLKQCIKGE